MLTRKIKLVCLIILLLSFTINAIPAGAQETTGTISGIVTDANGALVTGATVTIRDTDKNIIARTVTTNAEGIYSAPLLPIGHYSVTVEATGFKKFVKGGIELNVSERVTLDATLEVGGATEEVVVQAAPVQVELQSSSAAGLVSNVEIKELPLNNRNFIQLVTLLPGVSKDNTDQPYIGTTNPFGQTNVISVSINGARSSQNSWTIDGADNVDRGSNLTLLNYPSVDAIAEFKVYRNHYTAEFGRNAAGAVSVITKSGGSQFHGTAYEFFRNDKLNANTYFNNLAGRFTSDPNAKAPNVIVPVGDPRDGKKRLERPQLRYNNFGYTIGGPVFIPGLYSREKSKTFFFFSEEFRRIITYSNFNGLVPTAAERQGIFTQPICIAANAAGTACTQSATQITNISPAAQAYITDIYSKLPLPNSGTNSLLTNVRNVTNSRQELVRVDHNFSQKLTLAVRYLHDSIPTEEPGGLFTGNNVPGISSTKTNSPGYSWVARSVQTFRPNLLNELGYAFSYGAIVSDPTGAVLKENSPTVAAAVKLPFAVSLNRIPTVSPGYVSTAGFGPYDDFNRNHNVYDNLTWIRGEHTMKFGTSIHFYQKTENAGGNNVGSFSFATSPRPTGSTATTTQQAWANFLLGKVSTFTQASVDLTPDIRSKQFEFYAQDDFRVRPNLTLNYGLRYSVFRQPYDDASLLTNFDPAAYNPADAFRIDPATGNRIPGTGNPLNGIIQGGVSSPFGDKVSPEKKGGVFAPVFGFAWDPFKDGKTAIRGGYGISYDVVLVGILEQNVFANPPFVQNVTISNTVLNDPASVLPSISAAPLALRGVQNNNDLPYIQQWSLDIQRSFGKDFIIDVGYYGSKGTHLIGVVDINQVPPGAAIAAGIITAGQHVTSALTPRLNIVRPFKGYTAINTIQPWFNSNYNSMQLSSEKRFHEGSLVRLSYTWSHALTDAQTDRSSAPQSFYFRSLDRGPAQFDRRNILSINYIYALPFFKKQEGILGQIFGGWQLSGIVSAGSGLPLTITTSNGLDPSAAGFLGPSASGPRPDLVGDPNLLSQLRTRLQWFNTAAYRDVPTGENRVGSSPRGSLAGPGYQKWDMNLSKRFRITEGINLQFRAEGYNIFNHTNFNGISTSLGSTTFGQVTSTRDPRLFQFALKLNY